MVQYNTVWLDELMRVTPLCEMIFDVVHFSLHVSVYLADADETSGPEQPVVLEGQGSIKLEGWWLKLRQFHGLIVKRFHCAKRNTKGLFSQILLPAFFVCVAMTVALSVPSIGEDNYK